MLQSPQRHKRSWKAEHSTVQGAKVGFEFNGTREYPVWNGYRPTHLVKDNYLTSGVHHYFDHRTCDAVSIYITINDEYLGRVRARKERFSQREYFWPNAKGACYIHFWGIVAMIGDLLWLRGLIKYDGTIREKKMKGTYVFTEKGEVKES